MNEVNDLGCFRRSAAERSKGALHCDNCPILLYLPFDLILVRFLLVDHNLFGRAIPFLDVPIKLAILCIHGHLTSHAADVCAKI